MKWHTCYRLRRTLTDVRDGDVTVHKGAQEDCEICANLDAQGLLKKVDE